MLSGNRYRSAGQELPNFRSWVTETIGVECKVVAPALPPPPLSAFPKPITNEAFLKAITGNYARISLDPMERLLHAHGHTAQEIFQLRSLLPKSRL